MIPWTAAFQASLSFTIPWSLLKLMSIESVMPSNQLILCYPILLLPSIFPITRVFSNESALHLMGPKYWSFSFSISPSNEHSGLISFRILLVCSPCCPRYSQESSWDAYSGLSGWVQLNHRVIIDRRWCDEERVLKMLCWCLWRLRMGLWAKECRKDSPLEPPERNMAQWQ